MEAKRWAWAVVGAVAVLGTRGALAADGGTDAGSDAADDGGDAGVVCPTPEPVPSTYVPPAYVPAAAHQNACSAQLISDYYTQCLAGTSTTCAPWTSTPDAAHTACLACLVTPITASAYGPLITQTFGDVTVSEPNQAGCLQLLDPNNVACATALQDRNDCDQDACNTVCPVVDTPSFDAWQTCLSNADDSTTSCQTYFDGTACASTETADGGLAAACFPTGASVTFEDDYNAIAPVFCLDLTGGDGGSSADAGVDASSGSDAGSASADSGSTASDAGSPGSDSGSGLVDSGSCCADDSGPAGSGVITTAPTSSSGCSCDAAGGPAGMSALFAAGGALALAWMRRRRR